MFIPDVNILVNAFRKDSENHKTCSRWLNETLDKELVLGIPDYISTSVVRVCTHSKIFKEPNNTEEVLVYIDSIFSQQNVIRIGDGFERWNIFKQLCLKAGIKANLVSDAYIAAIVIDEGGTLVTLDSDFSIFGGLKYIRP